MNYANDESGNGENWAWQGEEYYLQKNSNNDMSQCLWNEVLPNERVISYIFDETTPVKACGDLAYQVTRTENMNKEPEEHRETSAQSKRRRMLQFDTQIVDTPMFYEEISTAFLKSNEKVDSLEEVLPPFPGFSDVSASSYEDLDQSSEGWIANCINDTEMHFSPGDMNFQAAHDIQIDISEFCNEPPEFQANVVKKSVARTPRNVVFKGRKSFIQTSTKLASSVAYPFAFIKPCGLYGDVTLKDINQRICTPPPLKSKQNEDDPASYPTSAFSGKPVIGKTKIRTEGGKGSITIMKTKG